MWDGYESRLGRVLYPARQKLIAELKKLEVSLTKSDNLHGALRVKRYRGELGALVEWPKVVAEIPEEAVEFQGNFYLRSDEKLNFRDAFEKCKKLEGHLVTISSKEGERVRTQTDRKQGLLVWRDRPQPGRRVALGDGGVIRVHQLAPR